LVGGRVFETLDVVRQANPITYIHPDAPPFLIIHGDQDNVVPVSQSQLLFEALQTAGVESEFMPLEGGDHGLRPYWAQIEQAVLAFFDEHIR
jgi:dipeptidyl aminopeptidase/acylaminoacyl peptidase